MASSLSQKLINYIIDHLHNDRKTLAVASTIAHSWVSPCQFHLFYSIQACYSHASPNYEDFASFLAGSPDIAANVRLLRIMGDMDSMMFLKILACLSNLSALLLRG